MALIVVFGRATSARADIVTISGGARVDDAPILDGEFAGWNFGNGPLLEAGFMGGIYAEHRATSVVRFVVADIGLEKVTSATLRLYKPKDFDQVAPVEVAVYEAADAGWREGMGICEPQTSSITHASGIKPAGKEPLATAIAPDDRGTWLEFKLPAELVQRWVSGGPNAGVVIAATGAAKEWGHHVYFHSSDHWSGKGPELVIEGTRSAAVKKDLLPTREPNLYQLPPMDSLKPWLEKNGRLARFTRDSEMNAAQQRLFQFYDTTVRDKLIKGRYQLPLVQVMREMDALLKRGGDNDAALREKLKRVRELLLVWEYIRETSWYTSGPLADALTPRQLGILFGRSIFGRMEEAANEKKKPISQHIAPDKLDAHVQGALKSTREKLKMTPEQFVGMEAGIAEAERLENTYVGKFRHDFDECRRLLDATDTSDAAMFNVVRSMHLNHELFLYYQSIYDTPRWSLLVKHAPPAPLAEWIVEARRGHYERQTGQSIGEKEDE
jgi:hypothetical protein